MGHIPESLTWLSRLEQHILDFFFSLYHLTTEYTHIMYLHVHMRKLEINVMGVFGRLMDQANFTFQTTTKLTLTNSIYCQWLIISLSE